MDEQMRKIGREMSVRMGLTMSFVMALVGTLTSGHFTFVGFLISFVCSAVIALAMGFLIPIGKITNDLTVRKGMKPGKLSTRCAEALISNLIYTPVITLAMVGLGYYLAMKQSGGMAQLSFGPMFLHSLVICLIVGFVLIFLVQPLFLRSLMGKYNIHNPNNIEGKRE